MHQSRRITWLVFIVGVIAVVDVLGWVSWRLVTFEREQQESRQEAARQEAIGRALWRMDSIVLPLLAVESARPYWEYQAFYPANRPADQMWLPPEPGDVLVPSPLLGEPGDLVRLHFERDGAGRLTSPQAPSGDDRLSALAAGVPEALLAMADIRLYELDRLDGSARAGRSRLVQESGGGLDLIDLIGETPRGPEAAAADESPTTGPALAIDPDATLLREAAPGGDRMFASGFERLEGTSAARTEEQRDAALADDDLSAQRSPVPGSGDAEALSPTGLGGVSPPPDGGPEPQPADLRQDYPARQQMVENLQTYNDAGRANRSRAQRAGYPVATTAEGATPTADEIVPSPGAGLPSSTGAEDEAAMRRRPDGAVESQRELHTAGLAGEPAAAGERVALPDPSAASAPDVLDTNARDGGDTTGASLGAPGRSVGNESAGLEALAGTRGIPNGVSGEQAALGVGESAALDQPPAGPVPDAGPLTPMWRGSGGEAALVLVRRVSVHGESREQGVWIDWPALRRGLEASVADLFPLAQVQPVAGASSRAGASEAQRLATLPVVLIPGPLAAGILPAPPGFWTPTRWTLLVGWIAVGIAVVAIGVVLRKAIDLGERRGRFVSAVTHELRTPLTTFRLYSQMLAGNAAMDDDKRARYAQTLDRESQRLSGIVESVLEYARLGRRAGAAGSVRQRLDAAAILDRVRPALAGRAERAGMDLVWPEAACLPAGVVVADPDKLERILLNLVDNACKYAAEGPDRRIVIDAAARDGGLVLGVRDFGPGIPPAERRRIFDAFHRARHHEASASPGLGLGLALSRGLAREMGGDLRLVESGEPGARFEITMPMA
jgi:signal transduction histidine kinase